MWTRSEPRTCEDLQKGCYEAICCKLWKAGFAKVVVDWTSRFSRPFSDKRGRLSLELARGIGMACVRDRRLLSAKQELYFTRMRRQEPTIQYHTIPYHTIPYHTIPYHTIPYHTIPYQTRPDQTRPDQTRPDHTTPHHTIPYHTIPYHIILHHTQLLL